MNDNSIQKQKTINEIEIIKSEISDILKNTVVEDEWNDSVSMEVQNKINDINAKKNNLIKEIENLEAIIKQNI